MSEFFDLEIVPVEEFLNDQGELEVQVGDFVSVAIDSVENGFGDTLLSRDKAKRLASWMALEKALESGEFVTGTTSAPSSFMRLTLWDWRTTSVAPM